MGEKSSILCGLMAEIGTILFEALILGLTLGTSCLISCLPVLVAHISADHPGYQHGLLTSVTFSLGRLIALTFYAFLFGLAGTLLEEFINSSTTLFLVFSCILIGFLVLYGISLAIGESFPRLSKKVCDFTQKNRSSFVLGILVGFFPCGPMFYMFGQAVILGANGIILSCLFFFIFWIGTNIYIFIAGTAIGGGAEYIRRKERVERIRWIAGFVLIILGVFHLLQLLNLF